MNLSSLVTLEIIQAHSEITILAKFIKNYNMLFYSFLSPEEEQKFDSIVVKTGSVSCLFGPRDEDVELSLGYLWSPFNMMCTSYSIYNPDYLCSANPDKAEDIMYFWNKLVDYFREHPEITRPWLINKYIEGG